MGLPIIGGQLKKQPSPAGDAPGGHGPLGRPHFGGDVGVPRLGAGGGYAGTKPGPPQMSQISWPRCRLLGVAVHVCPAAQVSATGIVVPP